MTLLHITTSRHVLQFMSFNIVSTPIEENVSNVYALRIITNIIRNRKAQDLCTIKKN